MPKDRGRGDDAQYLLRINGVGVYGPVPRAAGRSKFAFCLSPAHCQKNRGWRLGRERSRLP